MAHESVAAKLASSTLDAQATRIAMYRHIGQFAIVDTVALRLEQHMSFFPVVLSLQRPAEIRAIKSRRQG